MTARFDATSRPAREPEVDVDADARAAHARRMGHDLTLAERSERGRRLSAGAPVHRGTRPE